MTGAVLGPIRQTVFVVSDAEAEAERWVRTYGVGPFFVMRAELPTIYRGTETTMAMRIAIAQSGAQQIELVEPFDAGRPSIFHDFVDRGLAGAHHVAFCGDVERNKRLLESAGCELAQHGVTPAGDEFVYLASPVGPPYVELVDPAPGTAAEGFFALIAGAADGWDGRDPIRTL